MEIIKKLADALDVMPGAKTIVLLFAAVGTLYLGQLGVIDPDFADTTAKALIAGTGVTLALKLRRED